MTAFIITIHVVACLVLILVVLLQAGKGADMGAALGGSGSSAMFGSSTASNPLARITTATAITFMGTSLMLAVLSARQASVFDDTPEPLASPPAAESSATGQGEAAAPAVIPASGDAATGVPASNASAATGNAQPIAEAAESAATQPPSAPAAAAVPSEPAAAAVPSEPAAAAVPNEPAAAAPTQAAPSGAAPPSGNAAPVDQAPSAP